MRIFTLIIVLLFSVEVVFSTKTNTIKIDSVLSEIDNYNDCVLALASYSEQELKSYLETTQKELYNVKIYNALCWKFFNANPPKAMKYAELQGELVEKINDVDAKVAHYDNMGWLYSGESKHQQSISFLLKSLKIKESLNDTAGISVCWAGLATNYYKLNNFKLALKYFAQTLETEKEAGRELNIASATGNIGLCYVGMEEIDKGLAAYLEAVQIYIDNDSEITASTTYSNIGLIYLTEKKDYDKALEYFEKAAKFTKELGDVALLSAIYAHISQAYSSLNDFTNALIYGKKSVKYAELSGDKKHVMEANESLAIAFYYNKNYQLAYDHYKVTFDLKDSIYNETSSKQIAEMQTKYDSEKKEAENSLLLAEKELDKAELDKKSNQQKMLMIGLFLALIIVVYVAYSLNQKKKTNKLLNAQNEEISNKNEIIEEKNKDITDSINYAQRIQNAILPEDGFLAKHFKSFIYYRPKDIVSGDFYWIKEVGDKIYFSVVDCTGHGVPGAFMSIIGHNSLNRIIDDFEIVNTGEILDKMNELVTTAVGNKSTEEVSIRDGMDMSICCIDKKTNALEYSGAQNSLYLLRDDKNILKGREAIFEENNILFYEIKSDKMAIGGGTNKNKYKTHSIQLEKEDAIYLFSDGYADQFGGPKGKKFMYKRFKKMLLGIQTQSMDKQLKHIDERMVDWMGDMDQLDDICMIGVKV